MENDIMQRLTKRKLILDMLSHFDNHDIFKIYHINTNAFFQNMGHDALYTKDGVATAITDLGVRLGVRNVDVFVYEADGTINFCSPAISGKQLQEYIDDIIRQEEDEEALDHEQRSKNYVGARRYSDVPNIT